MRGGREVAAYLIGDSSWLDKINFFWIRGVYPIPYFLFFLHYMYISMLFYIAFLVMQAQFIFGI